MNDRLTNPPAGGTDTQATHGIGFPRIYDLLLFILTGGRERQFREDVLRLARIAPGDHVLDIGCGTGTQAIAAWHLCQPGGTVTGADISAKMLAVARRKAGRAGADIAFHCADSTELPFGDGRFDVATITTVMHMLPENRLRRCLGDAHRILKPGGRLLLIDYAGETKDRRHWSARHGPHGRFDLRALRMPLTELGFRNVESGPLGWLDLHFMRGVKDDS
jgi:SAM-dependent methyltransferase